MDNETSVKSSGDPGERVLLVLIVTSPNALDHLVTGLVDIGAAATIVESKGLMTLLREEMPMFGGLAAMLPQASGQRVILSVTEREIAERVLSFAEREFRLADRPIVLTVAIEKLLGPGH